jgi:hypothetical protein
VSILKDDMKNIYKTKKQLVLELILNGYDPRISSSHYYLEDTKKTLELPLKEYLMSKTKDTLLIMHQYYEPSEGEPDDDNDVY